MVLVWTPVNGSTKCSVWFTVWCSIPMSDRSRYPLQGSVRTMVPGSKWSSIIALSVSALRSSSLLLSEVISTPPTTQIPSTRCPRLYPNLDSTISTMIPPQMQRKSRYRRIRTFHRFCVSNGINRASGGCLLSFDPHMLPWNKFPRVLTLHVELGNEGWLRGFSNTPANSMIDGILIFTEHYDPNYY